MWVSTDPRKLVKINVSINGFAKTYEKQIRVVALWLFTVISNLENIIIIFNDKITTWVLTSNNFSVNIYNPLCIVRLESIIIEAHETP